MILRAEQSQHTVSFAFVQCARDCYINGRYSMVKLDEYVLDSLMRDLVGHDRRPVSYLVYLWLAAEQQRHKENGPDPELLANSGIDARVSPGVVATDDGAAADAFPSHTAVPLPAGELLLTSGALVDDELPPDTAAWLLPVG